MDDLQLKHLTLPQFCRSAKRLLEGGHIPSFVRFVLTGIHGGYQAVVDPIQDRLDVDHPISARRDYDSLLGIDRDIKIYAALTLFPKSPNYNTLRKNIHLKYSFQNAHGPHTVPVHKIPNVCIGKWNVHNTLRVLVTGLYSQDRKSVQLDPEEHAIFCEKGFWPAVHDIMGDRADDWPPDYRSEAFRENNAKNRIITQSKVMADWCVADLAQSIRHHLGVNNVPWADGIYILHQIQGVKNSSVHRVDSSSAAVALDEFLDDNDLRLADLNSGHWWIDVGLELTSERGECLAWRTDSHAQVVMDIAEVREDKAIRVTRVGSSKYTRDMTSHIPKLSGCRITPGSHAKGPFEIRYLQLYLTDKSVTARNDGSHHGNYITGKDILAGLGEKYLEELYEVYRKATAHNNSHARVEVRVPIQHATKPLIDLDIPNLRASLVSFPKTVWWGLRAYRCLAFSNLIQSQIEGPAALRTNRSALLVTAAAPWFLNGLHCVPDSGPASRDLITAILPHVQREDADPNGLPFVTSTRSRNDYDESDDEMSSDSDSDFDSDYDSDDAPQRVRPVAQHTANTVPYIPYGILFLRPIRFGDKYPVPRFSNIRNLFIKDTTFKYIFGIGIEDAEFDILTKDLITVHPTRISNKGRRTVRYTDNGQQGVEFNLARRGHALQPPAHDGGSDMEMDQDDDEPPNDNTILPIDKEITRLWHQFLLDITSKSPNPKPHTNDSYCKLSKAERAEVTEATYQNTNLADYFNDCQWKIGSTKEWNDVFDRLWPEKNHGKVGKVQNYSSTIYYPKWLMVIAAASPKTVKAIRKDIRNKFDSLYWMPHAQTDRIWWTKFHADFKKSSNIARQVPSPRILVRDCAPYWST